MGFYKLGRDGDVILNTNASKEIIEKAVETVKNTNEHYELSHLEEELRSQGYKANALEMVSLPLIEW